MLKQNFIYNVMVSVLGIAFGLILCFANASDILNFVFFAIGLFIIINSVTNLLFVSSFTSGSEKQISLYGSLISLAIGILLLFFRNSIANIIAGCLLLIFPIIRIIGSADKKMAFKREFFKLLLGLIVIFCGVGTMLNIILKILGGIIIACSIAIIIVSLVFYIKMNKQIKKEQEDNEVIDV